MEFTLKDVLLIIRKYFILIALCAFAGLSLGFLITRFVMAPAYTASVELYVNSKDTTPSSDLNELYYAQRVVNTYISFLQTKVFYHEVLKESRLDYTPEQLREMTVIKTVNNTEIFEISVTSNSAEDSFRLVSAMQKIAPKLIQSNQITAGISVVDPAVYPLIPSGPNILLNSAVGGFLGCLLVLLLVFLKEVFDVKVKDQDSLKRRFDKPILGEIPDFEAGRIRIKNTPLTIIKKLSKISPRTIFKKPRGRKTDDFRIIDASNFVLSEAYKALRTNLRYLLAKDGCKKLLICSPLSMEGKSTICSNIGISIAQTGAKVLLIDCDMRKGRLHHFFKLKSNPGVSELLSGIAKDKDVIKPTAFENLHIIPMGVIPPNPTELLSGNQMEELLKLLEKSYDFIIIDSPPVNVISDALSMIKLVDGVILAVRANYTTYPNVTSALSRFDLVGAKILGFVLNGISLREGNRSKSQYYYYR